MHLPLFNRSLPAIAFFGDVFCYYLSLVTALVIRYGSDAFTSGIVAEHQNAFTYGLILWFFVAYVGGLYERRSFVRRLFDRRFFGVVMGGGITLILLFYFIPAFGITPKINLLLFIITYAALGYGWRMMIFALHRALVRRGGGLATIIVDSSLPAREIFDALSRENSSGYKVTGKLYTTLQEYGTPEKLIDDIRCGALEVIVISPSLERDPVTLRLLYEATLAGAQILSVSDLYEQLFEKVSLATLDEAWFIRNLASRRLRYQPVRRLGEIILAFVLIVLTMPLTLLGSLLIMITSRGGALYKQKRIGFNGKPFLLTKLRTMYGDSSRNPDAEGDKAQWTEKNDPRVTPIGWVLRRTHIDELPQLFNILMGSMSFVGPRPERPEFTHTLEKSIPFYQLRYLVSPGIAGWAQLQFRYGASESDAYEKLQYDIFYIKHRSFLLDLTIFLKTLKRVFFAADE